MRQVRPTAFAQQGSMEARCDALLLGRLGSELALIYHDTLQAPLPAALQELIDRLDPSLGSLSGNHQARELSRD